MRCDEVVYMLTLLICWRWRLCVDLRLSTDACVDPERTVCTFIYCLNLTRVTKVRWLQCHSHALLCCPNTLQWQWWLCVDLRLLVKCIMKPPGIVLALNEQKVRFHYCCVRARTCGRYRCSMRYEVIILPSSYVVRCNVWNVVVLALHEQYVRLHCCAHAQIWRCY